MITQSEFDSISGGESVSVVCLQDIQTSKGYIDSETMGDTRVDHTGV